MEKHGGKQQGQSRTAAEAGALHRDPFHAWVSAADEDCSQTPSIPVESMRTVGWRDGSVGDALAIQARGPELTPQKLHKASYSSQRTCDPHAPTMRGEEENSGCPQATQPTAHISQQKSELACNTVRDDT